MNNSLGFRSAPRWLPRTVLMARCRRILRRDLRLLGYFIPCLMVRPLGRETIDNKPEVPDPPNGGLAASDRGGCGLPRGQDLLVESTPSSSVHIQCINTHGGRYGNFSSDLRTPLGDGRFPESGYSSPAQVRSSFTAWPAPGGEVRPPVGQRFSADGYTRRP